MTDRFRTTGVPKVWDALGIGCTVAKILLAQSDPVGASDGVDIANPQATLLLPISSSYHAAFIQDLLLRGENIQTENWLRRKSPYRRILTDEPGVTKSAVSKRADGRRQGGQDALKGKPHPRRPQNLTESQMKKEEVRADASRTPAHARLPHKPVDACQDRVTDRATGWPRRPSVGRGDATLQRCRLGERVMETA